jgi:hypothetical protein
MLRTVIIGIVGLLVAGVIAWYAGEAHYDSCVDAAIASHPLGEAGLTATERQVQSKWDQYRDSEQGFFDEKPTGSEPESRSLKRRQDAIDGCSRLP